MEKLSKQSTTMEKISQEQSDKNYKLFPESESSFVVENISMDSKRNPFDNKSMASKFGSSENSVIIERADD